MKHISIVFIIIISIVVLSSCVRTKNKPGFEYMPDMAHSLAYETYTTSPRSGDVPASFKPVAGSIAQGSEIYNYPNTEVGKQSAIENLYNPYSKEEINLENGKRLYENQCAICHGKDGAGQGDLVNSGKYPPVPPTYFGDRVYALKEGGIYHAIMYGMNAMGSYATQLNPKQRWEVVAYIREMQLSKAGGADKLLGYRALASKIVEVKTSNAETTTTEALIIKDEVGTHEVKRGH